MIKATLIFARTQNLSQFIDGTISPAVRKSVQAGAELIQQSAQGFCPVDTGRLRDSITVDVQQVAIQSVSAVVGPHTDYADFVEFGTGRAGAASAGAGEGPYSPNWPGMPAQPYMRPAIDENREPIKELFRGALTLR